MKYEKIETNPVAEAILKKIEALKAGEDAGEFFEGVVDFHNELLRLVSEKFGEESEAAVTMPIWQALISSGVPQGESVEVSDKVEEFVQAQIVGFLNRFD